MGGPRRGAAARPAPALLRGRSDPGPARGPLRGALRARARAADGGGRCGRPTSRTVSADRRRAELVRLAAEPSAVEGLGLLAAWGLLEPRDGGLELAAAVAELLEHEPWHTEVYRPEAILSAALGPAGAEADLAAARPRRPSEAVALAGGRSGVELALARALGAEWLDAYLASWRWVRLEIDGEDLIAAGIPQGPALGRGLRAALTARLDGEVNNRDEELAAALAAAREG